MIYVLQNLLTQAQLEILLARLENWRLSLKAGDFASMILQYMLWLLPLECGSRKIPHLCLLHYDKLNIYNMVIVRKAFIFQ